MSDVKLLTEQDARANKLPGSDVFLYSHLLYKDELHQMTGTCRLNAEAYKAFCDSNLVKHSSNILTETKQIAEWLALGGLEQGTFPPHQFSTLLARHMNLESLKIGSGFELHLKSRLLRKGYLIHQVTSKVKKFKPLYDKQKQQPVRKEEYFKIDGYRFDGKLNRLVGITENSINFSKILKDGPYRDALTLKQEESGVIDDYRKLRNQIHLPGDIEETPYLQKLQGKFLPFLIHFINSEIVEPMNELVRKYSLHRNLSLEKLS